MDPFQLVREGQGFELSRQFDQKLIDANVLNRSGQNLLQEAIANKQTDLVASLLERGVNVNHQDGQGQTALHFAALYKDAKAARAILEKGGDLSIRDKYGNSPLWTAVFNARRQYETVRLYMASGADATTKNQAGRSPIDFARQIKDDTLIDLLGNKTTP